jgi:hypothetical protein
MTDSPKNATDREPTDPANGRKRGDEPRKRGGQPDNRNSLRHGLRGGQLPRDARFIEFRMNAFRRKLEDAVIESKGAISLIDAASIQTAMKWERHGALALRWLTKEGNKLKPAERLTFSREVARASTERDKALAALRLDRDSKDRVIEALYSPVPCLPAPTDSGTDLEDK